MKPAKLQPKAPAENPVRICEWCPSCQFRSATYQADTCEAAMYRCQRCGHGFEAARPEQMRGKAPAPVTHPPLGVSPGTPVNDRGWRWAA